MSFIPYTPRPGINNSRGASMVFDMSSLDKIKRGLSDQGKASDSELEVAKQFEALILQQILKQGRQTGIESGLWNSDQTKMINAMGDEQRALDLANSQGTGLAQALVELMQSNKPVAKSDPDDVALNFNPASAMQSKSRLPNLKSSMEHNTPADADPIGKLLVQLGAVAKGAIKTAKGMISRLEPTKNATDQVANFVHKMGEAAVRVSKTSGIPVELIMSQAALESGWGKREIKMPDGSTSHNLFGIKATGNWTGKVVHVMTTEYVDGKPRKVSQPFRAYDSYEDSLKDYARLLSTSPRYEKVAKAESAQEAAVEVQKAGYATDPSYAQKLISIMAYFQPK